MKPSDDTDRDHPHHRGGETHLVREIIRTQQALMSVFSRQVGVPAARLAVLRLLAIDREQEVGVMELARKLDVNAAAVTRLVQEMEAERILTRRPDLNDARRTRLKLTARGYQLFESLHERNHAFENALRDVIGPEDLAVAERVLVRLRRYLETLR